MVYSGIALFITNQSRPFYTVTRVGDVEWEGAIVNDGVYMLHLELLKINNWKIRFFRYIITL